MTDKRRRDRIETMNEEQLDTRLTFRLCEKHRRLIEREAKKRYLSTGDVLREIVREWVRRQQAERTDVH